MFWFEAEPKQEDQHIAFRGAVDLPDEADVTLQHLGATWYTIWIGDKLIAEGPPRFPLTDPEYAEVAFTLPGGKSVLAIHAQYYGVETRLMPEVLPFLHIKLRDSDRGIPILWRCKKLDAYRAGTRRINPLLGWVEWCDTRQLPEDWKAPDFDDADWDGPVPVKREIGELAPLLPAEPQQIPHTIEPMAEGPLAPTYGYDFDDIPARFFLRDLVCEDLPPQGVWRRYDLGRVRLGRPRFELDVPEGTQVEFAYSETLAHGRVQPYITLSAGPSCNFDHYVARGGRQVFFPNTPKGGRYLEVHLLAPQKEADAGTFTAEFVKEDYLERVYWGAPEGSFQCDDPLLNTIWSVGVETLRACSDDAITDNPTRERGQWTGDVVTVGMAIASCAFEDLRLFRRALEHSALSARADGMVAGQMPGTAHYLATYAAQWVRGCTHYHELTGNNEFLENMYPYAKRNVGAFERFITGEGLVQKIEDGGESGVTDIGWIFVDWGYVPNPGPSDMALNQHFLASLRAMIDWSQRLNQTADVQHYEEIARNFERIIRGYLDKALAEGGWEKVAYHRTVLALALGLLRQDELDPAIAYIKEHMLRCFPNDPDAPRNDNPTLQRTRLITPYFSHYAYPPLIEHGEMDFVLDQFRTCWGWMLDDNRTTLVEVFDTRWSHCHQWGGCPTWQLTRYTLGLHPRFNEGAAHFRFDLRPGDLQKSAGRLPLPLPEGGHVDVSWERSGDLIRFGMDASRPVVVLLPKRDGGFTPVSVEGREDWELILPQTGETAPRQAWQPKL